LKIIGGEGATLDDLEREGTFVTVLLQNPTGRADNLRIAGVHDETITFTMSNGEFLPFVRARVKEIRVQEEGRVSRIRPRALDSPLSDEEQSVVDRAAERALEIFQKSQGNQILRISAAVVLAASDHEDKDNALQYLQKLASGNDVPTAMLATSYLYAVGLPPDPKVVAAGFESGNRGARALAANIAGLTNNQDFLREVETMLNDSTREIFPAAAVAIGRMNLRSGLPHLYEAMEALTEEKGEAAVFALSEMGGEDVHQRMLQMLETSRGVTWFRVLRVLFALDDARAKKIMKEEALLQPAYKRAAGILITEDGDFDGKLFLREYIKRAEDPNMKNLIHKAQVATTLFSAGDIQAKSHLQRLVNTKPSEIYAKGRTGDKAFKKAAATAVQTQSLAFIAETGSRELLSLLVAPLESADRVVAITACTAAMAIGNPEFGMRLQDIGL